MAVFMISLIAVGGLIYAFHDKPNVFTPILTAILGIGSGFGVATKL